MNIRNIFNQIRDGSPHFDGFIHSVLTYVYSLVKTSQVKAVYPQSLSNMMKKVSILEPTEETRKGTNKHQIRPKPSTHPRQNIINQGKHDIKRNQNRQ